LRRHQADPLFDFPNTLPAAASYSKQTHVIAVDLRMIGTDQAKQRRFTRSVRSQHRPTLTRPHRPRQFVENATAAVLDSDILKFDDRLSRTGPANRGTTRNKLFTFRARWVPMIDPRYSSGIKFQHMRHPFRNCILARDQQHAHSLADQLAQ